MGIFSRFKKGEVIDYTDYQHRLPQKKSISNSGQVMANNPSASIQNGTAESSGSFFGFLGNLASSSEQSANKDAYQTNHEEDKKTEKHLSNLTNRYEDLSNQIYRLQQRIEVLEQKLRAGRGY